MNTRLKIILGIGVVLLLLILLVYSFKYKQAQESCLALSKNLDKQEHSLFSIRERCYSWEKYKLPLFVGGNLKNISITKVYDYYEYNLTFEGIEKDLTILIRTKKDFIPYETGEFYKFNLNMECRLSYSSTDSGFFYDPDLNKLIKLTC
jgi:hypothetical protein